MHFGHPDKYRQVGFLPLTPPTEPPTTRNGHFLRTPGNLPTCKPTLLQPRQKHSTYRQSISRRLKKHSTCRCTFRPKCKAKPKFFAESTTCRWSSCHNRRSTGGAFHRNENLGFRAPPGGANLVVGIRLPPHQIAGLQTQNGQPEGWPFRLLTSETRFLASTALPCASSPSRPTWSWSLRRDACAYPPCSSPPWPGSLPRHSPREG
jgi:hypothetical protein